jgi:hypothetical protein
LEWEGGCVLVEGVDPLEGAVLHADLGLPVPPQARYGFPKRVLARFARLFTSHQVEVNRGLIDAVRGLRTALGEVEHRTSAVSDRLADDLAAVRTELSDVQLDSLERIDRISQEVAAIRRELEASRRGAS